MSLYSPANPPVMNGKKKLIMTTQSKLERLKWRSTNYELILTDGNQKYLVCYCRKSSTGAIRALQSVVGSDENGRTRLITASKVANVPRDNWQRGRGIVIAENAGWIIQFSGRTQREAICDHELPYIGSVDTTLAMLTNNQTPLPVS